MNQAFDPSFLLHDSEEKPLDRLAVNGGYCRVFRTMTIVGDSLASGEFESVDAEGVTHFDDRYAYAWGTYLGHMAGMQVQNYSRGGMTAQEFCDTWAVKQGFWQPKQPTQGYILALGVNDVFYIRTPFGTVADIHPDAPERNAPTFAGYYGRIIQHYASLMPGAKFFLVTIPRGRDNPEQEVLADRHAALLYEIAALLPHCYVVDLRQYAPAYDADFRRGFFLRGHMNPLGYIYSAELIGSYIDFIVRHHPEDFAHLGFLPHEG